MCFSLCMFCGYRRAWKCVCDYNLGLGAYVCFGCMPACMFIYVRVELDLCIHLCVSVYLCVLVCVRSDVYVDKGL